MELYSKHLDGIFFLEPIGVELETSLTVKVAWVFFQVTVFENLLKCLTKNSLSENLKKRKKNRQIEVR